MTSLRNPIPAVAFLSLGLVACNEETVPLGGLLDVGNGTGADGGGDSGVTRDTGGADTGGTDTGGIDADGDMGGTDSGGSDSGGSDSGGTDSGGTDSGGADSGGADSGADTGSDTDTGGPVPGTLTAEELAEVSLRLCIREGQCDGEEGYREDCERYAEVYAAEYVDYINALGEDCARTYLSYLDCIADNAECRTDEDGYTYLDASEACSAEYAAAVAACPFDEYDYDGGVPIPEP